MRVSWTRPARRHLDEIGQFISRDNPRAAAEVVIRILDQVDALGEHPHLGRPGRFTGTRELVVNATPFIAVYRVSEQQVDVLAVFHGARRWPGAL
jgi:addiction module RelE/StbE family toxin